MTKRPSGAVRLEEPGSDSTDKRVIVCNYLDGTSPVSPGSRAYVQWVSGDPLSVQLLARSRGGRYINKWERTHRLVNFRIVTVPPCHPLWPYLWGGFSEESLMASMDCLRRTAILEQARRTFALAIR